MKKLLSILMFLILIICVVGCSHQDEDECGYECNEVESVVEEKKEISVGDYVDYPVNYYNGTITEDSKEHRTLEKGWRILFIDDIYGKKQVTLISNGIPIIYFYRALDNRSNESVYMLTDGFFDSSYVSDSGVIDHCGFYLDDLSCSKDNMKKMFSNKYTMVGNDGNPLVRSLTIDDLEKLFGKEFNDYDSISFDDRYKDLILSKCFPCEDNDNPLWADKYVDYWLGSSSGSSTIWKVSRGGSLYANSDFDKAGIKVVVTLDSSVSFEEQYDDYGEFKSWKMIKD